MVSAGLPPESDPRRCKGGPAVLSRARRQSMGWPALLFSIGLHGVVVAAAVWLVGGQGSGGDAGDQRVDADSASAPVPMLRPLPPQEQRFAIQPHRVKKLKTANLPRFVAQTQRAELLMPKWQMAPMKPIEAAPPPPAPKPVPSVAAAQPIASTSSQTKGHATSTQRKAAGKGSGTGHGSAMIAAAAPKLVRSYPPPYPSQARRDRAEGTAVVKVIVDENGSVNDCSIWTSAGHSALDTAALRAVKGWKFTPAVSASASVLVKVTFRLS